MNIYIKINLKKKYFKTDDNLAYIDAYVGRIGNSWEDYLNGKFVKLNNKQIEYMKKHPNASIREIWVANDSYNKYDKELLKEDAEIYYKSSAVKKITINGISGWLNDSERTKILNKIQASRKLYINNISIELNNTDIVLNIDKAESIICMLEIYSNEAREVYKNHIRNINALKDGEMYDVKKYYAQPLSFDI